MKKTDIGVVAFMYAVCAFFYAYSYKLTEESKTYPMFTIALLFALTTLYLVQMIINARKFGVESGADEVFAGFKPVQFIVSIVLTLVYFLMITYLGFFLRDYHIHVCVAAVSQGTYSSGVYLRSGNESADILRICEVPRRQAALRAAVLRRV